MSQWLHLKSGRKIHLQLADTKTALGLEFFCLVWLWFRCQVRQHSKYKYRVKLGGHTFYMPRHAFTRTKNLSKLSNTTVQAAGHCHQTEARWQQSAALNKVSRYISLHQLTIINSNSEQWVITGHSVDLLHSPHSVSVIQMEEVGRVWFMQRLGYLLVLYPALHYWWDWDWKQSYCGEGKESRCMPPSSLVQYWDMERWWLDLSTGLSPLRH